MRRTLRPFTKGLNDDEKLRLQRTLLSKNTQPNFGRFVLGCIEADLCKKTRFMKLWPRSTKYAFFCRSQSSNFLQKKIEAFVHILQIVFHIASFPYQYYSEQEKNQVLVGTNGKGTVQKGVPLLSKDLYQNWTAPSRSWS